MMALEELQEDTGLDDFYDLEKSLGKLKNIRLAIYYGLKYGALQNEEEFTLTKLDVGLMIDANFNSFEEIMRPVVEQFTQLTGNPEAPQEGLEEK